jgi:hypothetical protein
VGALSAPSPTSAETDALAQLTAACAVRDDGTRMPLRWCRRLHAQGVAEGFVLGLQAMLPAWLSAQGRRTLVQALLAADTDTAGAGNQGAALLRQDGRHALLHRPADGPRHRSVPIYVRAAFAALAEAADADGPIGLADPRLSAHERLRLAERLHLSALLPAPRPGPTPQRLLFLRTQGHFLLLEHRPDADLPRLLGLHA